MKSKILYALAGALFSLAVLGFLGFKNKQDSNEKYATATIRTTKHYLTFSYENGNETTEKYDPQFADAIIVKAIGKMDSEGYDLCQSLVSPNEEGFLLKYVLVFKKRNN